MPRERQRHLLIFIRASAHHEDVYSPLFQALVSLPVRISEQSSTILPCLSQLHTRSGPVQAPGLVYMLQHGGEWVIHFTTSRLTWPLPRPRLDGPGQDTQGEKQWQGPVPLRIFLCSSAPTAPTSLLICFCRYGPLPFQLELRLSCFDNTFGSTFPTPCLSLSLSLSQLPYTYGGGSEDLVKCESQAGRRSVIYGLLHSSPIRAGPQGGGQRQA
ncbi:hypothetical protein V8E36_003903 [Tilletia maclaganii]